FYDAAEFNQHLITKLRSRTLTNLDNQDVYLPKEDNEMPDTFPISLNPENTQKYDVTARCSPALQEAMEDGTPENEYDEDLIYDRTVAIKDLNNGPIQNNTNIQYYAYDPRHHAKGFTYVCNYGRLLDDWDFNLF